MSLATVPVRTGAELALAAPELAGELVPLIRGLRRTAVGLGRLASEEGELTAFLREAARLAAARTAEAEPARRMQGRRTRSRATTR